MENWRISRCHIMYIWTCMYLLALQQSVIYLLREKRTCHSGNTTTNVFAYLYNSFFCLHYYGITILWCSTSMMVPLVMTPKLVYMVDVGFFFTPMMGRQNVAFSSGCVTCALLNRRPWKRQKMFQKQIWYKVFPSDFKKVLLLQKKKYWTVIPLVEWIFQIWVVFW